MEPIKNPDAYEMDQRLQYAALLRGLLWNGTAAPLVRFLKNGIPEKEKIPGKPLTLTLTLNKELSATSIDFKKPLPPFVHIEGVGYYALGADPQQLDINTREGSDSTPVTPLSERDRNSTVKGKVAIVTGGAQGFGYEIGERLAKDGAVVWIADLNYEGALEAADKLNESCASPCVFPVAVNVADESSVWEMVETVVSSMGGIDLFISNAGVLKAGSVKELSLKDFSFVTSVNYIGYFICTKYVSRVMALQNQQDQFGNYYSDIIQINSKSGLKGSNKNGAYAGGKFGGLGLTQSFALELITDKIKVNSICPGNFFDGPLWSDPDRGLFVQYLHTGKVPGAKTIEEVKQFYEAKVPMARGCNGEDVYKAILYSIEQLYETGQAVPVTGGQEMLN